MRYAGYDASGPAIDKAIDYAEAAGVGDRVRFQQLDALRGLPERHDVITTFDVVHDVASPRGLLGAIRRALKPDGIYVCLDANVSDKLEENFGPLGTVFYGVSVLYCMTTSLAHDGEGLGRLGLNEQKLQEICTEAGYGSVRRVPLEDPFNSLYEIKP
jgi:2-polyprenyl-3-methyl-5-hydroxy-6-metoxy-1,4-benzoquinol methylase